MENTEFRSSEHVRVTVLTNLLAPYRVPLFETIASTDLIDLNVLCMSKEQKNREWYPTDTAPLFSYSVLSGYATHSYLLDRALRLNPTVIWELWSRDPDVLVLGGYSDPTVWLALAYATLMDTPVAVWMGSWEGTARLTSRLVRSLKRAFVRRADAWIVYGSRAAEWVTALGADKRCVHEATNTVDMRHFHDRARELGTPPSGDDPLQLLYCGQLIPRKNVGAVIEAIDGFQADDLILTVVGDGPERDSLETQAEEVAPKVRFEGPVDRDQLPGYYGSVDTLVLPSLREVWGLVVNEALACGSSVLVSERCGCAPDLVEMNFNGSTFDPERPTDLRRRIDELIERKEQLRACRGDIARDAMERASLEQTAEAFVSGIQDALRRGRVINKK